MDVKFLLMGVSILIGTISFLAYIKQLFRGSNRPHPFSWLIWALTQSTIAAALLYSGAGWGVGPYFVSALLVFAIFLTTVWKGSKDITPSDMIVLAIALSAIVIWWLMGDPLVAVFLITGIDLLGYLPTFRKVFVAPRSEPLIVWTGFLIGSIFAILAQEAFSLTTLTYPVSISAATVFLILLSLSRRWRAGVRTT